MVTVQPLWRKNSLEAPEARRHQGRTHPVALVLILDQKAVGRQGIQQPVNHGAAELHPPGHGGEREALSLQKQLQYLQGTAGCLQIVGVILILGSARFVHDVPPPFPA